MAVVTHDRFELEPGSFEKIRHFVNVELYLRATEVDSAEVEAGRLAYAVIAAFRTHVTLFDTLTTPGMTGWAAVRGGGPPAPEDVNGQPFSVYPMIVQAVEAGPAIYTGG